MNRRIRKKRRVGEFTQYGFSVRFRHSGDVDALFDAFIEVCERHDIALGGGASPDGEYEFFLVGVERYRRPKWRRERRWRTCSEEDRAIVQTWLTSQAVTDIVVGPLEDANR